MIDRYALRYFLAVVDHGNFSRAATQCNVAQPTLSVGIAKLERALGRELFVRTNRRVELTAAGTRFALHARRIEAEFHQAEQSVRAVGAQRTLRLGIITTLPTVWHESLVHALRPVQAIERVEFVEGREREILDQLSRGRTDLALTIVRTDNERFQAEPLFSEGYALAMNLDHPCAREKTVTAETLADNIMIVRRHCEALADISRHFTSRGVRPFFSAKTTNDDRALALVRSGLGITVMPACFASSEIAMPALSGFKSTRTIGILIAPHVDMIEMRATSVYHIIGDTVRALSGSPLQE